MQFVRDIYAAKARTGQPVISFEFFPPKTDEGDRALLEKTVPALMGAGADYCSVTYGAGGSTRQKTLQIVDQIQRLHGLVCVAHLTCVSAARSEISNVLKEIADIGVKNVLALRGDPPGGGDFKPSHDGFEFAEQLVRYIHEHGDFSIGVAGFPEGHIACKEGKHKDWEYLKRKVEAGADYVLTQLFFDNADYFAFRDVMTNNHGVKVPLVPGIIPILSASQIKRFTSMCGARIPPTLAKSLEKYEHDDAAAQEFGIEYAAQQCKELLDQGAPGIHFYTLNKARSTRGVLERLGLAKPLVSLGSG
jgi:methylenetetrahydrofolate reductase (NADPH)